MAARNLTLGCILEACGGPIPRPGAAVSLAHLQFCSLQRQESPAPEDEEGCREAGQAGLDLLHLCGFVQAVLSAKNLFPLSHTYPCLSLET